MHQSGVRWMLFSLSLGILLISGFQSTIRPSVGELAPEIAMANPKGDTIRLSHLRGQMVLIDFWASWCKPCRVENHHIRQAYLKFKDKEFQNAEGFTVLSISLDTDSLRWTKAIVNDKLYWEHHVSDFKKWDSETVRKFNFSSLPHNLLIDGSGIILAKGLFGQDLESTLQDFTLK